MSIKNCDFDFSERKNKTINVVLDELFNLTIEKQSSSTAAVYCTNKKNEKCIPHGFKIINTTSHEFVHPVSNIYILCWTDNYTITFNDVEINLQNKHVWDVKIVEYKENIIVEDYHGSDSSFL